MAAKVKSPGLNSFVARRMGLCLGRLRLRDVVGPALLVTATTGVEVASVSLAPAFLPTGFVLIILSTIGALIWADTKRADRVFRASRTRLSDMLREITSQSGHGPIHPSTLTFLETGAEAFWRVKQICVDPEISDVAEHAMLELIRRALQGDSDQELRKDLLRLAEEAERDAGIQPDLDSARADLRVAMARLAERRQAQAELISNPGSTPIVELRQQSKDF